MAPEMVEDPTRGERNVRLTCGSRVPSPDEISEMIYAVAPVYRRLGTFKASPHVAAGLLGRRDADGRLRWAPQAPSTLMGYPVTVDPAEPGIAFGVWE